MYNIEIKNLFLNRSILQGLSNAITIMRKHITDFKCIINRYLFPLLLLMGRPKGKKSSFYVCNL